MQQTTHIVFTKLLEANISMYYTFMGHAWWDKSKHAVNLFGAHEDVCGTKEETVLCANCTKKSNLPLEISGEVV